MYLRNGDLNVEVLGRGYSLTRHLDDLTIVRTPAQVKPGDWLVSQVHGGRIVSRVETVIEEKAEGTAHAGTSHG